MRARQELLAEAKAITAKQWTIQVEEYGDVEFVLDDFEGYTIVVARSIEDVFWGAFALFGTYANPQEMELGTYNTAEAARQFALQRVALQVAYEIEWEEKATREMNG